MYVKSVVVRKKAICLCYKLLIKTADQRPNRPKAQVKSAGVVCGRNPLRAGYTVEQTLRVEKMQADGLPQWLGR